MAGGAGGGRKELQSVFVSVSTIGSILPLHLMRIVKEGEGYDSLKDIRTFEVIMP